MGFASVARRAAQIGSAFVKLTRASSQRRPTAALLVNYTEFNLRLGVPAPRRRYPRLVVRRAADLGMARGAGEEPASARRPAGGDPPLRGGAVAGSRRRRALRRSSGAGSAAALARRCAGGSRAHRARLRRRHLAGQPGRTRWNGSWCRCSRPTSASGTIAPASTPASSSPPASRDRRAPPSSPPPSAPALSVTRSTPAAAPPSICPPSTRRCAPPAPPSLESALAPRHPHHRLPGRSPVRAHRPPRAHHAGHRPAQHSPRTPRLRRARAGSRQRSLLCRCARRRRQPSRRLASRLRRGGRSARSLAFPLDNGGQLARRMAVVTRRTQARAQRAQAAADRPTEAPFRRSTPPLKSPWRIGMERPLFSLVAFSAAAMLVRGYAASRIGFGDSEALYAAYALHPAPAYLDHPGLVGLVMRVLGAGVAPSPADVHRFTTFAATMVPFVIAGSARLAGAKWKRALWTALVVAAAPEIAVGLFALTPDLILAFTWPVAIGLAALAVRERPKTFRANGGWALALLLAGIRHHRQALRRAAAHLDLPHAHDRPLGALARQDVGSLRGADAGGAGDLAGGLVRGGLPLSAAPSSPGRDVELRADAEERGRLFPLAAGVRGAGAGVPGRPSGDAPLSLDRALGRGRRSAGRHHLLSPRHPRLLLAPQSRRRAALDRSGAARLAALRRARSRRTGPWRSRIEPADRAASGRAMAGDRIRQRAPPDGAHPPLGTGAGLRRAPPGGARGEA